MPHKNMLDDCPCAYVLHVIWAECVEIVSEQRFAKPLSSWHDCTTTEYSASQTLMSTDRDMGYGWTCGMNLHLKYSTFVTPSSSDDWITSQLWRIWRQGGNMMRWSWSVHTWFYTRINRLISVHSRTLGRRRCMCLCGLLQTLSLHSTRVIVTIVANLPPIAVQHSYASILRDHAHHHRYYDWPADCGTWAA